MPEHLGAAIPRRVGFFKRWNQQHPSVSDTSVCPEWGANHKPGVCCATPDTLPWLPQWRQGFGGMDAH